MTDYSTPRIIIAIDGYSSSGKSTMAKALARRIGYVYVDSGAMYRAVTLYALDHGMVTDGHLDIQTLVAALPGINVSFDVNPATGASETILNGVNVEREIRSLRVSDMVSPVAAVPEVRTLLTHLQQQLGEEKGIVMDGRDIGTTVFPNAEMKVFVEASPEIRARRRYRELIEKGMPADYEEVYKNITERDRIDRTRAVSPLTQAPDAHLLVNDNISPEDQLQWLCDLYETILSQLSEKR